LSQDELSATSDAEPHPSSAATAQPEYLSPTLRLPCHYIPHGRNDAFFGRQAELVQMAEYFFAPAGTHAFRSFAVTGLGGVGKTELVNEFVHAHESEFSVIMWISAVNAENIERAYSAIAIQLGIVQEGSANAQNGLLITQLVLNWLADPLYHVSQPNEKSPTFNDWFLVFDNADDLSLLQEFLPDTITHGNVIITSRASFAGYCGLPMEVLSLEPFNIEESTNFLLRHTGWSDSPVNRKQVIAVAELMGGLPLALHQATSFIKERHISFDEYIEDYCGAEREGRLTDLVIPQGDQYEARLDGIFDTVVNLKGIDDSRCLLQVLAFLDPDSIPELIFSDLGKVLIDAEVLPPGYEYTDARTALVDMSLLSRDAEKQALSMHRVVHEACRMRMSGAEYSAVLTTALELLHAVWPREVEPAFGNETDSWDRSGVLFSHVVTLGLWAHDPEWHPPKDGTMEQMGALEVILEAAWYVMTRDTRDKKTRLIFVAGFVSCSRTSKRP
jgi:hypothetical protein